MNQIYGIESINTPQFHPGDEGLYDVCKAFHLNFFMAVKPGTDEIAGINELLQELPVSALEPAANGLHVGFGVQFLYNCSAQFIGYTALL